MEPFRDDQNLTAALRELRPEPRLDFTAELDERAAAGFPRHSAPGRAALGRLATRLSEMRPRRLLIPAGATALAAVAAATVVVALGDGRTDSVSAERRLSDGAGVLSDIERFAEPAPAPAAQSLNPAAKSLGAGSNLSFDGSSPRSGPYASRAPHRDVERSAEMVLGAEPDEVAGNATEVFDAVHAVDGIVLSSSVTGGAEGNAGARFDLLIPVAKLGDALADFSAIATVVSRHEATDDITAPTVRTSEYLRDSRARIDGLLTQLAGADSDEERAEVETELRSERRHAAVLRSQAAKLSRRANLSRVSLRIETGAGASGAGDSGSWGIGDALGDAGHILGIAAGVTIVGLAILAPLALIAFLTWLVNRTRLRRARERALA